MASRYKPQLRGYRVADGRHPLFDGTGAAEHGGRWNSPAYRVIYASLSYAGAIIERLAQTGTGRIPRHHRWIAIDVPPGVAIEEVGPSDIPGWDAADVSASRAYGDRWLTEARTVALVVPAVVGWPVERNVLFSQTHPDFKRVKASRPRMVRWDKRLFGRAFLV